MVISEDREREVFTILTELTQKPMARETKQLAFTRPERRASESSVSSADSWLSGDSTISSSRLSECFSTLGLPLELELSIMGTVDQSVLDRAHVAQDKRGKRCSSRSSRQLNSRTKLVNVRSDGENETRINEEGLLSTTLCSTEL